MAKDERNKVKEIDETLLLVSGSKGSKEEDKKYVKKLANAILQVFDKHETAKLRCVGAGALNNAVKSFIIAQGEAQKKGIKMFLDPSFTTVQFKGNEKTGIVLEVVSE